MDKKKIKLIIEFILFILALCLITFIYYFSGNTNETETEESVGIVSVTDENFESVVLNSEKTVVLEFSSNMCPPCITMIPTMISIAKNNKDILVATVNNSEKGTEEISKKYNIEATPTILIIKNGEIQKTFIGATSEENIMEYVK